MHRQRLILLIRLILWTIAFAVYMYCMVVYGNKPQPRGTQIMRNDQYWQELRKIDEAYKVSKDGLSLLDLIPYDMRLKNLDDYEMRDDGKIVRKDRWERGIRSIQIALSENNLLKTENGEFEIDDVVKLAKEQICRWQVADFTYFEQDDFEDMNYKRYLVTAVTLDVPYTMQGVFLNGVFYQDEDNTKEIKNVTHYAVMPKPATGE